jgi:hypothetical protein
LTLGKAKEIGMIVIPLIKTFARAATRSAQA